MKLSKGNRLQSPIIRFALQLATRAGNIATLNYKKALTTHYKEDGSPVTNVDKEIEQFIRGAITKQFPRHTIIGEEYPNSDKQQSQYTWYIDPIDGTVAFINGIPLFTTLIALYDGAQPLFGIIHNPILRETVIGITGGGCYYNKKKVVIHSQKSLAQARFLCSDIAIAERAMPHIMNDLSQQTASGRTWCDAYGYLLLVSGRAEIVFDVGLKPWDIAPLYVIVKEAQGHISACDGAHAPLGTNCIACTPQLSAALLAITKKYR